MSASRSFAYNGLTVRVETSDPADLVWLEEFLVPWFTPTEERDADCTVTLVDDAQAYDRTLRRGPRVDGRHAACFALDRGVLRFPWWTSAGVERVIFDDESRIFYCVDRHGSQVRILRRSKHAWHRIALMRAVREFAMTHAWTPTRLVIHGAALARRADGVIIAGPKGAGKTSLLIHALRTTAAQFVSNDRVVVDLAASQPVMRGMPTVITLRDPTPQLFPELAARLSEHRYRENLALREVKAPDVGTARSQQHSPISLSPAQFCEALDVEARGQCGVRALLFPRVTQAGHGIDVRQLSARAAAQQLTKAVFAVNSSQKASEVFVPASHPLEVEAATLEQLCAALATRVPSFECRLGEHAYAEVASVASLLDRLLPPGADTLATPPAPLGA